MEREQDDVYRRYKCEVEAYIGSCEDILDQLDDCQGLLAEMHANYRFVNDNSKSLQTACEGLLEEQVRGLSCGA
jgi:conserved oligomeric Golgi complex subunit 3